MVVFSALEPGKSPELHKEGAKVATGPTGNVSGDPLADTKAPVVTQDGPNAIAVVRFLPSSSLRNFRWILAHCPFSSLRSAYSSVH